MILNELFDRVVPYHFTDRTEAVFKIGDKAYTVSFMDGFGDGSTEVIFELDGVDDGYSMQGTGNEILVFSTVLKIMNEYVSREKVAFLTFAADLTEPSRIKLYDRMVKVLGKSWQVIAHTSGTEKHYELRAPQAAQPKPTDLDSEDVPF